MLIRDGDPNFVQTEFIFVFMLIMLKIAYRVVARVYGPRCLKYEGF